MILLWSVLTITLFSLVMILISLIDERYGIALIFALIVFVGFLWMGLTC